MTPMVERMFYALLWLAHPGVDAHLEAAGEGPHPHTECVEMAEQLLECWQVVPGLALKFQTFRKGSIDSARYRYQTCSKQPSPVVLVPRYGALDQPYAEDARHAIYARVGFVEAHAKDLEDLAEFSGDRRYHDLAQRWRARANCWSLLARAMHPNGQMPQRRGALKDLRICLGDERFARLDLPSIWHWYPHPFPEGDEDPLP
jgi:hypothetical protein